MTKMFKKAISLLVVCALAFTTLATGVFAAAVPTISLDAVATDLTIGDEAVVTVTSANSIGDWGAYQAKVTIPDGLTVKTVMYKLDDYEAVELEALNSVDYVPGDPWYNVKNNVISFVDVIATASTVVYTITFDAIETAGTYAVVAALATADAEILEESEQTVNFVVSEAAPASTVYTFNYFDGTSTTVEVAADDELVMPANTEKVLGENYVTTKYVWTVDAEDATVYNETTETVTATVNDKLAIATPVVNISESINFAFRVTTSVKNTYASCYLDVNMRKIDGKNNYNFKNDVTKITEIEKEFPSNDLSQYKYSGIAMYELSQPITVTVVGCNADGDPIAYHTSEEFSVASVMLANTKKMVDGKTPTAAQIKNLRVFLDLVNVGKTAQEFFINQTESKGITSFDLKDNATLPTVGFEAYQEEYAGKHNEEITAAAGTTYVKEGLSTTIRTIANVTSSPAITFRIQTKATLDGYNGVYAKFDYHNDLLNSDPFTGPVAMADMPVLTSGSTVYPQYIYSSIALYDADKIVTYSLYDENGTLLLTNECSLNTIYLANMTSSNKYMVAVVEALNKFGQSAKARFY